MQEIEERAELRVCARLRIARRLGLAGYGVREGQPDLEDRALAGLAAHRDLAAVGLGHPLRDREPQPAAARLARLGAGLVHAVEALEEVREVLGRDPRPVVRHPDPAAR